MFKNFLIAVCMVALMAAPAFSWGGASMNVDSAAISGNLETSFQGPTFFTPLGGAGGFAGAGGSGDANASGKIAWGKVNGDVDSKAAGLTSTNTGTFKILEYNAGVLTLGVGVSSQSAAEAVAGAKGKILVDGFLGAAGTCIRGVAVQGTLDASGIVLIPFITQSNGFSGGIAGQTSAGAFEGGAIVLTFIGKAGATVGAEITMFGQSGSSSYQYVATYFTTFKTEGQGTDVFASTKITSRFVENTNGSCLAGSLADVDGGWSAKGVAATLTVQTNEFGGAYASAVGTYSGHGSLGSNYNGSVTGHSATSITTFNGMNGSLNQASASMHSISR